MKAITKTLFVLSLLVFIACSCDKKKEEEQAELHIKMIDDPADYQQVNVDVLQVKVHHSIAGWIDLPTIAGVYDLLTLQNDVAASLVNGGIIPAGTITQLRVVLGNNNSIMVDSVLYNLNTPSAQQSGLKINVNHTFQLNQLYEMVLDFVVEESIVEEGNGAYSLKPVIKIESINPL